MIDMLPGAIFTNAKGSAGRAGGIIVEKPWRLIMLNEKKSTHGLGLSRALRPTVKTLEQCDRASHDRILPLEWKNQD